MDDKPQSDGTDEDIDIDDEEILEIVAEALEESLLQLLRKIEELSSVHDVLPIASVLESHREANDDYAALRLVSAYFAFGGWLVRTGVKEGLFEPDEAETWRSDESRAFEDMLDSAIRGGVYKEGGFKLVSCSIDVNIEEFDEEQLFERLVHGKVTKDEFHTYVARCDVERLRDALVDQNQVIDIKHPDSGIVIDSIAPDDTEVTARIRDEDGGNPPTFTR